jgi:hypothetical protein
LHVGDPVDIRLMAGVMKSPATTCWPTSIPPSTGCNWPGVPVRIAIDTSRLPDNALIAAGMTVTIEVRSRAAGKQQR